MRKFILLLISLASAQWIIVEKASPPLLTSNPNAMPESASRIPIWAHGENIYLLDKHMWKYEITTNRWLWQPEVPIPKRTDAAYWTIQDKFYVYGGLDENGQQLSDMWFYDPATRIFSSIYYQGSSFSCSGSAFWKHETTNRLYMWGGLCTNETVSTLRSFDINSKQWLVVPTHAGETGEPAPAKHIAATIVSDTVYLYSNDKLWQLDMPTYKWTQSHGSPPPGPKREYHAMWSTGTNVFMYGGRSGSKFYTDTWLYANNDWSVKDIGNGPSPRWGFSTCSDDEGNLYLFGGGDENDLWKYGKFTVKNIFQLIDWKLDSATFSSSIAAVMSTLVFFGLILLTLIVCIRGCVRRRRKKNSDQIMQPLRRDGESDFVL